MTSYNLVGLPAEVDEYDYGASSPIRRTITQYANIGSNILNKPSSIVIYDQTGNIAKQSTFAYDAATPAPAMGGATVPGLHTFTGPRGNLTSRTDWVLTNSSITTATHTYDTAGQALTTTDPRSGVTRFAYDGTYDSYLTSTTSPPTGTTSHTVTYTNDVTTGLRLSTINENGVTTKYEYNDPFLRTTRVRAAVGTSTESWTTTSYDSSNQTRVLQDQVSVGDGAIVTTKMLDGLGRVSYTIDAAGSETSSRYDVDGRLQFRSDPASGTGTTYAYDGLDRVLAEAYADGSVKKTSYSGATTTTTDEAGNAWQRKLDALGRLVQVVEPGALTTTYTYNATNDLLCADQWSTAGAGQACVSGKSRRFAYDLLSRLLTTTNPESGTTSYNYFANGAPCAGDLSLPCSKTDANGMTITFGYDALNRLTQKTAPDGGNTNATLIYDQGANGIGRLTTEYTQSLSGTQFSYDALGRVAGTQWYHYGAGAWQNGVAVKYDLSGNRTQLTYPDGKIITQNFDHAGRVASEADITSGSPVTYINGGGTNGIVYWPSGQVQTAVYGNGVSQTFSLNNRLQLCRATAGSGALAARTGEGNLSDRSILYGSASSCGTATNNNGNISAIVDNLLPNNTQSFMYDRLNRLTSGSQSGGWYNQTYAYDSFGNMIPQDNIHSNPSYSVDPSTNRLAMNGTLTSGNLNYDSAGYLRTGPYPGGQLHSYTYTAEGYLRSIDNYQTGSYLINSLGERTLAVHNNNSSNEYVYLNGKVLADVDNTGRWTDYIYAADQKIARVQSTDAPLHLSGTTCSGCGSTYTFVDLYGGAGRVIQSGDSLNMSQYAAGGAAGGAILLFTDGSTADGSTYDQSGQQINCDLSRNQWLNRHIDISAFAGKTLAHTYLINDACASAGPFDIYFNDVAISGNGTTSTIYTAQPGMTFSTISNSSGTRAVAEPNSYAPAPAVHYYLADQIGSTQLELSSGGWPTWQGEFTPFGQEIVNGQTLLPGNADGSSMRYKFSGKERDNESGLDEFGARFYAGNIGRWISPDWSPSAQAIPYAKLEDPQTLNLYTYVRNNPLNSTDPDGHMETRYPIGGSGWGADDGISSDLLDSYFLRIKPKSAQPPNGGFTVILNGRKANVVGGGVMHVMGADHVWITTSDGKSVGMGTAKGGGQIPDKDGGSSPDKPGDPTQLIDEHGDTPTWTRTFTNVNQAAIDSYLTPGKATGNWLPSVNDCNTWAVNAIGQSTPHDVYNMHTEQWTHNAVVYANGSVHVVQQ